VNDRRRLQGLPGALAAELALADPAQLVIDQRQQPFESLRIAAFPGDEERRDLPCIFRSGHNV
jgi:hypothetical protein